MHIINKWCRRRRRRRQRKLQLVVTVTVVVVVSIIIIGIGISIGIDIDIVVAIAIVAAYTEAYYSLLTIILTDRENPLTLVNPSINSLTFPVKILVYR